MKSLRLFSLIIFSLLIIPISSHGQDPLNPTPEQEYIPNLSKRGPVVTVTADMAKFYFVVAGMEFMHCLKENDGTVCANFIDGLKDPVGHVGFYLFMKGNKWGMSMAEILSKGKISPGMGSYLGLATGMMVQSIFQELYYHPLVEELKAINRIEDTDERFEKKKAHLKKMWKHFKSNAGSYLFNKIPNVMGLLGAAYLSKQTMKVAKHALKGTGKAVKFTMGKKAGEAYLRYGRNLNKKVKLAKSGIKIVVNGSKIVRIHPIFAIGSYVVETVVFLAWAPVVEDFMVKKWKLNKVLRRIKKLRKKIEKEVLIQNPNSIWANKLLTQLEKEHDNYRQTVMHSAQLKQAQHFSRIKKVDDNFERIILYYEWLIRGMKEGSDLWKSNPLEFREFRSVDASLQKREFSKAFFCGPSPKNAVKRKKSWRGVPVPFEWGYDYFYDPNLTLSDNARRNKGRFQTLEIIVEPFQVVNIPGLCLKDTLALNGGDRPGSWDELNCPVKANWDTGRFRFGRFKNTEIGCRLDQEFIRNQILKSGRFAGAKIRDQFFSDLDKKSGTAMEKIWVHRELMIYTYEKALQKEILEAFSGKDVTIRSGRISFSNELNWTGITDGGVAPLGVIPHLAWENNEWKKWRASHPKLKSIFDKLISNNKKKRQTAHKIMDYSKKPFFERVRKRSFFQNNTLEDWQKIVETYRAFIIH